MGENNQFVHIAVTGASGRIGNVVVRQLIQAGYQVRVLLRRESPALAGLPVETIQGHLLDTRALQDLCKGADAVIHLAAVISIQGDPDGKVHQANVEGTRLMLHAALANGVRRVICFSSVHAFRQAPQTHPIDETRALAFDSTMAYDRSKAAALRLALDMATANPSTEILALCPTAVLGPWDFEPSLAGQMLLDLYRRKIPMLTPGGFDWCDVTDVAGAAVAALHRGRSGEAYLLPGTYATLLQVAALAEKVTGVPAPTRTVPFGLLQLGLPFVQLFSKISGKRPLFTHESLETVKNGALQVSGQKASQELGYTARPLEQTIAGAYQWFDQFGYL
ncbi:MAG TPA: NAD-dependent epimerase [Saprospirales bacterium]|nr:NAD-dependent epimerase [Saprospirales bacterium]